MGRSRVLPQMHVLFIRTLCFAENGRGTTLSALTVGHRALPHHGPYKMAPRAAKPVMGPSAAVWWGLRCQEECLALLQATLFPPHLSLAQAFVCTPWEENNPLASDHTWIQPPIWHLEKWGNSLMLLPGLKPGWIQLILTPLIRWWVSKGRPHLLEKLGKERERKKAGKKTGRKKGRTRERKKETNVLSEKQKRNTEHLITVTRREARNNPFPCRRRTGEAVLPRSEVWALEERWGPGRQPQSEGLPTFSGLLWP